MYEQKLLKEKSLVGDGEGVYLSAINTRLGNIMTNEALPNKSSPNMNHTLSHDNSQLTAQPWTSYVYTQ